MPYVTSLLGKFKDWKISKAIDKTVEKMDPEKRKKFCLECYLMSDEAGNMWSFINTPSSGYKEISTSIGDIMTAMKNQNLSNEFREIQQILEKYSKEGSTLYFKYKMGKIEERILGKYGSDMHLH